MCGKNSNLCFNTLKNEKMIPQEIRKIVACTRACREHLLGFEVHRAVVMESCVFWNKTPCMPLEVNRCFRGTCCSPFSERKNKPNKIPA
jgi:hypothetical protein